MESSSQISSTQGTLFMGTSKHQLAMTMSTPTSSSRIQSAAITGDIRPIEKNRRSKNIPLPLSHMKRTQSEVQLCEDMETAEQRDLNMFYRLVNGIRERQMNLVIEDESSIAAAAFYNPAHALTEAERSLARIIHTRNAPVEKKNDASSASSTTSFRIKSCRLNNSNNILNNWNTNLNPGIPILEDHSDSMYQHQHNGSNHENGWSVGDVNSSSNLLHDQQQQHFSINNGAASIGVAESATSTLPTVHKVHSSSDMADEGMFDFEL